MKSFFAIFIFVFHFISSCSASEVKVSDSMTFSLAELLEIAETNNPLLREARIQVERQDGRFISARSNFLPNVSLDAEVTKEDESQLSNFSGTRFGSSDNWRLSLLVDQKIYTGGRITATFDKSKALRKAAEKRLEVARNHIFYLISEKHAKYIQLQEVLESNEGLITQIKKELWHERKRKEAGQSPEVYVLRLELLEIRVEKNIIDLSREKEGVSNAILKLCGFPLSSYSASSPEFSGTLNSSLIKVDFKKLYEQATGSRPEFKRFEHLILAADKEVEVQRSRMRPELALFASYGVEKDEFSDDFYEEQHGWKIGISGKWTLFDGGETKGLVKTANAEKKQRKSQMQMFALELEREFKNMRSSVQQANELHKTVTKVLAKARKALSQVKARYLLGKAAQSEVMEAQVALNDFMVQEIDARYRLTIASQLIQKVIGGEYA